MKTEMYRIVFSNDAKKDLKELSKKAPQAVKKLSRQEREHTLVELARSSFSRGKYTKECCNGSKGSRDFISCEGCLDDMISRIPTSEPSSCAYLHEGLSIPAGKSLQFLQAS